MVMFDISSLKLDKYNLLSPKLEDIYGNLHDISRYTLIIVAKFIQQRNNYTLFNFRIVAKKIKYNSMQLEVYYH